MITIITNKIKQISQKIYDEFIGSTNINSLTCSCGISGRLIKHGYYTRTVKTSDGLVTILVLRVICKSCLKTHAIFPEIIVPYSQLSVIDHLAIISAYTHGESFEPIMNANLYIDEVNIRYIIRQYLIHWKERIAASGLSIKDTLHKLIINCLITYKRQFMQIKCTSNVVHC